MPSRRPACNRRLAHFGTTIFTEFSRLAVEHGAVNLGQGFPDFAGPAFLKEAAARAIAADKNQYGRMAGVLELCEAIAAKTQRHYGLSYDPVNEVTVYAGCTEAIHCALSALCEPGDEVLLFEPYYDSYRACVAMAGATPRFVTLRAPEFRWDPAELRAAFNERTRVVLVNSPNNPSGRVFDRGELAEIAALAREHDAYVVSDEVYEHLVFEGEHVPIASLPGMRERTVTLSSTGKTFSLTGWKIGYSLAAPEISAALRTVHQFVTFSAATPLQHALIPALDAPSSYYEELLCEYRERRRLLCEVLDAAGLAVIPPQGTYFVCADVRPLGFDDDLVFCRYLVENVGVAAIPPSAFYEHKDEGRHLARFAFCKSRPLLEEAGRRLARLRQGVAS